MLRSKQALGMELLLQLLKGNMQIAHPIGHQTGAVELIGTIPGIDADAAGGDDLHTVFRAKAQVFSIPDK